MIKQFFISDSVKFFKPVYEDHGLKCVNEGNYDRDAPCLFVGMYRTVDMARAQAHNGERVVLWMGIDAESADKAFKVIGNTINIVINDKTFDAFEQKDRHACLIKMPNTIIDFWEPCELGSKVYCYAPNEVYGLELAEDIADSIDHDMIITQSPFELNRPNLLQIYKECFVGLRLRNRWDGSSASVHEMGLMGRKTIWNGGTPTAISWNTKEDVVNTINDEAKKIGTTQNKVASDLYKFLDIGDQWLWPHFLKEHKHYPAQL